MSTKTRSSSSKQTTARRASGTSMRRSPQQKMESSRQTTQANRRQTKKPSSDRQRTMSRQEAGRLGAEARWGLSREKTSLTRQSPMRGQRRNEASWEESPRRSARQESRYLAAPKERTRYMQEGQGRTNRQTTSRQNGERVFGNQMRKAHEGPTRRGFEIEWDYEDRYDEGRRGQNRANRQETGRRTEEPRWSFLDEEDFEEDSYYAPQNRANRPRETFSRWAQDYQEGNTKPQQNRSLYSEYERPASRSRRNNKNYRE